LISKNLGITFIFYPPSGEAARRKCRRRRQIRYGAGYWKKLELFTKKTPMLISKKIARAGREGKGFQGKGIPAPPSLPPPQFFVFRFAKNVVCPLLFLIFGIVL